MEMMKKLLKKPVVWLTAFAVILVGALAVRNWDSTGGTGELPQNTTDPASSTVDAADVGESQTGGTAGSNQVTTVDLEDDEAGANDDAGGDVEDDPTALIPSAGIPTINQKLTWEAINSFPVKSADMSTDELRALCVDFLRFAKTALWTPDEDVSFIRNKGGSADMMSAGIVYGGLPYVGVASGSVYRLMDYIDEATGVVDMGDALNLTGGQLQMSALKYFGNQCSIGAYWGWGRVINSANYLWTQNVVQKNGFIILGEYPGYDIAAVEEWESYEKGPDAASTVTVCNAVGAEQMYKNYALLQPGDGLVYYTTAGHVVMCASVPHVVDTSGNVITDLSAANLSTVDIDGASSYITIIDQGQSWKDGENASGDQYRYKSSVDSQIFFADLFSKGRYVPFTFEEFHGGAIEETEASFSHSGSTITRSQLFSAKVTANYGISDIYAIVTDDSGSEVYRHAVRTSSAGRTSLNFVESGENVDSWGTLSSGTYTVEIVVQLATGERPTVYIGTLKA